MTKPQPPPPPSPLPTPPPSPPPYSRNRPPSSKEASSPPILLHSSYANRINASRGGGDNQQQQCNDGFSMNFPLTQPEPEHNVFPLRIMRHCLPMSCIWSRWVGVSIGDERRSRKITLTWMSYDRRLDYCLVQWRNELLSDLLSLWYRSKLLAQPSIHN